MTLANARDVIHAAGTRVGLRRPDNQDEHWVADLADACLFVVCDGMGGHAGGADASRLVSAAVVEWIRSQDPEGLDSERLLRGALSHAGRVLAIAVKRRPELAGIGTTCTALLVPHDVQASAWCAHIGDSRLYRLANGLIGQLTEDHSVVMELVRAGAITVGKAADHPMRHSLTRVLGGAREPQPDIFPVPVLGGDRFLLCTDGVTGHLLDEELVAFSSGRTADEYVEMLLEAADDRGGTDNSTAVVVEVPQTPSS